MSLESLPKNLTKRSPFLANPEDYLDSIPLQIRGSKISIPEGDFQIEDQAKRLELLTQYKHIFHFSPPNKIIALFDKATEKELTTFALFGEASISGYRVKEYSGTFIITKNGSTTQIINIAPRLRHRIKSNLDSVNQAMKELLNFHQMLDPTLTLLTPAASSSSLALSREEIFAEVKAINHWPINMLDKFNAACMGGIMESSGIGTQYMVGYDMKQCHLNILKDFPSPANAPLLLKGVDYRKNHLATSIYKVKWTIPQNITERIGYWSSPIPYKTEAGLRKPTGSFIGWYYKDYLDLALWMNKKYDAGIEFKVIDSYVFLDSKPSYPFRDHMESIHGLSKFSPKLFPNIEIKALYNTLAGSSKSIRRVIDPKTLAEKQVTSTFFSPVIYGFVLSRQNCLDYTRGITKKAIALKIDATEEPMRSEEEGFYHLKGEGLGTFLTQYLKTTESSRKSLWREAIEASAGLPFIEVLQDFYPSIKYLRDPYNLNPEKYLKLGKRYTRVIKIKPSYGGNRQGPPISDVSMLLDDWYQSHYTEDEPESINHSLLKIEKFQEFFPK